MKILIFIVMLLTLSLGSSFAETSGTQLKADLVKLLTKSYDTSSNENSVFNTTITNLKAQLDASHDWEFDELAPLLGYQVNQLSRLDLSPSDSDSIIELYTPSFGTSEFPNASYPNSVTWNFGIDKSEEEPEGDANDRSEVGSCTGGVRNSPRKAFDLQMGAIISEGISRVALRACEQVVVVIGGGNGSLACLVTEIADIAVQGVLKANQLCDDIKDSVEIEASYKRLGHIHDNLDSVNSEVGNVNTAVSTVNKLVRNLEVGLSVHDSNVNSTLITHDNEVKTTVTTHDTDIKSVVDLHNTNINALFSEVQHKLEQLQTTSNTNSEILLEIVRLLHTPNGARTSTVLACNGVECEWNK